MHTYQFNSFLPTQRECIMCFIPLSERGTINSDNTAFYKSFHTNQLIIASIVHNINDSAFSGNTLKREERKRKKVQLFSYKFMKRHSHKNKPASALDNIHHYIYVDHREKFITCRYKNRENWKVFWWEGEKRWGGGLKAFN